MSKKCIHCNAILEDDAKFCMNCLKDQITFRRRFLTVIAIFIILFFSTIKCCTRIASSVPKFVEKISYQKATTESVASTELAAIISVLNNDAEMCRTYLPSLEKDLSFGSWCNSLKQEIPLYVSNASEFAENAKIPNDFAIAYHDYLSVWTEIQKILEKAPPQPEYSFWNDLTGTYGTQYRQYNAWIDEKNAIIRKLVPKWETVKSIAIEHGVIFNDEDEDNSEE